MKTNRIFCLVLVLFVIICSFTGCKEKKYAEVYTKFSENVVTFLSQDTQGITAEITILDGELIMNFEKSISIWSNQMSSLRIDNITDNKFLSDDAQIINVCILKQQENGNILSVKVFSISFGVVISACIITIIIKHIARKNKKALFI